MNDLPPTTDPRPDNHLVVDFDDDEPEAPALAVETDADDAPPTSLKGGLVVELDTDDAPAGQVGITLSARELEDGAALPGFRTTPSGEVLTKKGVPTHAADAPISPWHIVMLGIAGLLGGCFGWLLSEPFQNFSASATLGGLVVEAMVLAGLIGLGIGAVLGAAPGVAVGVASKVWRGLLAGALFGLLGGMLGGSLAQFVYGATGLELAKAQPPMALLPLGQVLLRAVGWSIMGLFFGLGQAAVVSEAKKMRNGLLGGALGGFLGGIAFELLRSGLGYAWLGRGLGFCVMGATIGVLIGFIEEAAKEAWLSVIGGPLTGKQFILYEERTVIGSSPKNGIALCKDYAIALEHAAIVRQGGEYILTHLAPGAITLVNDRPTVRHLLEDGDTLTFGATRMAFCARGEEREKGRKGEREQRAW